MPTLATPPRGGPKTPANPQPTGVGKTGGQGGVAPWRGLWGCPPTFTPTEVSLFEKGRPSPTLIKAGVEGAQPPPRGFGGCAPKNLKRGRVAHISNLATSGTQNAGKPPAHEGGQRGVHGGKAPLAGGERPTFANSLQMGSQNASKPQAKENGQNLHIHNAAHG